MSTQGKNKAKKAYKLELATKLANSITACNCAGMGTCDYEKWIAKYMEKSVAELEASVAFWLESN